MKKKNKSTFMKLVLVLGSFLTSLWFVFLGWILYSRRYIDHNVKVSRNFKGEHKIFESSKVGKLSYFVDNSGSENPLLILHSINAAAGVHEIKPIYDAFRRQKPVYALELPGFGDSDRGPRSYSPELYREAIIEMVDSVIGNKTDIVALSLSSEFVAQAAQDSTKLIRSIVLISPTGFGLQNQNLKRTYKSKKSLQNLFYAFLAVPLWSRAIFDIIASRPSIAHFLQKSFTNAVPEGMIEIAYASAHQPGSHCAPIAFLSGKLFTEDIRPKVYNNIEIPVLVIYDRDVYTRFEMLPSTLHKNINWKAVRIKPSCGMPHFDKPGETFYAMDSFWKDIS